MKFHPFRLLFGVTLIRYFGGATKMCRIIIETIKKTFCVMVVLHCELISAAHVAVDYPWVSIVAPVIIVSFLPRRESVF